MKFASITTHSNFFGLNIKFHDLENSRGLNSQFDFCSCEIRVFFIQDTVFVLLLVFSGM